MNNKQPRVVVIDDDGAKRKPIKEVFPRVVHHPCGWYLCKNASKNVKKTKFVDSFSKTMNYKFPLEELKLNGRRLFLSMVLKEIKVSKTYEIRHLWAIACLREKFFAHIQTMS